MMYFKIFSIKLHYLVVVSTFLIATCAPLPKNSEDKILDYTYTNDGKGNYNFRFETSNGITREETGTLIDTGLPNEHISVQGTYSYINPDGETVTLNYIADENGYSVIQEEAISNLSGPLLASLLGK